MGKYGSICGVGMGLEVVLRNCEELSYCLWGFVGSEYQLEAVSF